MTPRAGTALRYTVRAAEAINLRPVSGLIARVFAMSEAGGAVTAAGGQDQHTALAHYVGLHLQQVLPDLGGLLAGTVYVAVLDDPGSVVGVAACLPGRSQLPPGFAALTRLVDPHDPGGPTGEYDPLSWLHPDADSTSQRLMVHAVHPDYRGSGIGTALLAHALTDTTTWACVPQETANYYTGIGFHHCPTRDTPAGMVALRRPADNGRGFTR